MKSKIVKLAVLPALVILLVAYLFIGTQTSTTSIVIAKENIQAGVKITPEMLTTMKLPVTMVPPNTFKDPKEVIGKQLALPRAAGDIIFKSMIQDKGIELKDDEVLIPVTLPPALKDFVSENTVLMIQTISISDKLPAQIIDGLSVQSVVTVTSSGAQERVAIIKASRDKAAALAPFLKDKNYVIMIQK
ncbi:SAF domain-containing protein [Thermoanaerobacter sp. RKWS2]|uniref:SAF domain-containing protein n=1 Tax=Thermoanaerobacter sp. RKWS2 TaxID=2983842 RepID=UPI00224B86EF|nr:SAF domain-containing protein [Thermoanaerobacter sp. RKWS2]UZQ81861.1 SAF domain-containing protein [Thermoanaerobacter sp. RKWS2]